MSASTFLPASYRADGKEEAATLPFWATPAGVHVLIGLAMLAFALVAATLHSTLGPDNAVENYNAQSWALSYASGDPPLYAWLLILVQMLTGPGPAGFAILNYGSLFTGAALLYRIARRAIVDPRLQALAIYAYCLLWDIGHESHRMHTHANLMIVGIAAATLAFLRVAEKPTFRRYLWLGASMAFGMLAKLAFAAFMIILLFAAFAVPRCRSAVNDGRMALAAALALTPIGLLVAAGYPVIGAAGSMLDGGSSELSSRLLTALRALLGYVVPLLPVAAAIFHRRIVRRGLASPKRRGTRRLVWTILVIGAATTLLWVLLLGDTQIRSRHLHHLMLLFPIGLFCLIDLHSWRGPTLGAFAGVCALFTAAVIVEQALPRLMPAQFLCDSCRLSTPYDALGREIEQRFGPSPTLVGLDASYAGRLRAAVPEARVVTMSKAAHGPSADGSGPCLLAWLDEGAAFATVIAAAGISAEDVETVDIPWFQPWLEVPRVSRFNLARLPAGSGPCR